MTKRYLRNYAPFPLRMAVLSAALVSTGALAQSGDADLSIAPSLPLSIQTFPLSRAPTLITHTDLPALPSLIETMQDNGAKVSFLGSDLGLNGWLLQKDHQIQTVYSTLDGKGVIIGLLYDEDGTPVTDTQLASIKQEILNRGDTPEPTLSESTSTLVPKTYDLSTSGVVSAGQPVETLKARLASAPGATYGTSGPLVHVFMDPRCPYCHALWQEALPLVLPTAQKGAMRLHVIPVGILGQASAELASSILGGDILENWWRAMDNQAVTANTGQYKKGAQLLEANNRLFFDWKGKGVPLLVFEDDGQLSVYSGKPDNLREMVEQIQ